MCFVDVTFLVLNVTKENGIRRTNVLTCGRDFVGSDFPVTLGFGLDFGVLNSLHTISALFHDATTSNRHFGVHHHVLQRKICPFQPIRTGNFQKRLGVRKIEVVESSQNNESKIN